MILNLNDWHKFNRRTEPFQLHPSEGIELDGVHAAAIKLLPQNTPVVAGTPTQVAGWGLTKPGGISSRVLMKADVPVIDYDECQSIYDGSMLYHEICAGTVENEMDVCEGDTGGALVYNGTLIGIATWGNTCGTRGRPQASTPTLPDTRTGSQIKPP